MRIRRRVKMLPAEQRAKTVLVNSKFYCVRLWLIGAPSVAKFKVSFRGGGGGGGGFKYLTV